MRISDWSSDVCSSDLWFIVPASPSRECPGIKLRCSSRFASSTTVNYVPVTVVRLRKGVRMNLLRILPLACLLAAGAAQAQSAGECPLLPGDSGLSWNALAGDDFVRSEEHTSELQSLMRISYAVFCL